MITAFRLSFRFAIVCAVVGTVGVAGAQKPSPPVADKAPPVVRSATDVIRYDPQEQGALFYVAPQQVQSDTEVYRTLSRQTLTQYAKTADRRVLRDGAVTALIPPTMLVIETPGKPDPFAGMSGAERLQLLMALFTPAQWKVAGSERGIGTGDLTEEQQPLFAGLMPKDDLLIQVLRAVPSPDEAGQTMWTGDGIVARRVPVSSVRLRLRRQTKLLLLDAENRSRGSTSPPDEADANRVAVPEGGLARESITNTYDLAGNPRQYDGESGKSNQTEFGQIVVRVVPNRAKPTDLLLTTAALRAIVRLDGSHKTVGELIAACAKVSGLDLRVDKRMASLAVAWRVAPEGHGASARTMLSLLTRSVTGTFRRLDPPDGAPPIYLLTDDRDGLGTRLPRLRPWKESAEKAKRAALAAATKRAAESDPLSHVPFGANDPLALPANVSQSLESSYRAGAEGVLVNAADLPPALRELATKEVKSARKYSPEVVSDRFRAEATLTCDYVCPDGKAFETAFGRGLHYGSYLRDVAKPKGAKPPVVAPPKTVSPPVVLPQVAPRRVCVLPLPTGDDANAETKTLLTLAKRKGFTEAWFRVSAHSAADRAALENAVTVGKSLGVAVGASAPLWKRGAGETWGIEDINLAGDTGAQAAAQVIAQFREQIAEGNDNNVPNAEQIDYYFSLFTYALSHWTAPDSKVVREPITQLAQTPVLSALVVTDTAAPGYSRETNYFFPGGGLGYNLAVRVACVREHGFDPVDVADDSAGQEILNYGGTGDLSSLANELRAKIAAKERDAVLTAIAATTKTPVYFDAQSLPFFVNQPSRYTRYVAPPAAVPEVLALAQSLGEYFPDKIAETTAKAARTAPAKTGFVVDFSNAPGGATRFLNAFADVSKPVIP